MRTKYRVSWERDVFCFYSLVKEAKNGLREDSEIRVGVRKVKAKRARFPRRASVHQKDLRLQSHLTPDSATLLDKKRTIVSQVSML